MKKYYIGVDVGTDSVGTACTDEHYNLLRLKGKDAWAALAAAWELQSCLHLR